MELKETFLELLQNKNPNEVISFMQSLTTDDKKELATQIKKIARNLNKYYNQVDSIPLDELTQTLISCEECHGILNKFAFVCLSYDDMRRACEHISLDEVESDILPWYQPSWINRYLLEMVNFYIDYEKMIDFMQKGWFTPTHQFIAQNAVYGLEKELLYPISQEHIWYLFEEDTNLYIYDKWLKRLRHYAHQKEISRERLLKETLLTSTRNFNKPQVGWFCKLFEFLEPTIEELLALQTELFLSLSSSHSKPVAQAIKYIKKIYKDERFDIDGFVAQIDIVFLWDVKSIINTTLILIDVIMKSYPLYQESLSIMILQAFSIQDENIQTKIAKILQKHKLWEDNRVQENLLEYESVLLNSIKVMLPNQSLSTQQEESIEIQHYNPLLESNGLVIYESFDDMVFFFSQVFEGHNTYDFDLFVALLPKMHSMLNESNIDKLEPIFQRAYQIHIRFQSNSNRTTPSIILAMSQAFLYYGVVHLKLFSILHAKLKKLYQEIYECEHAHIENHSWIKSVLIDFDNIKPLPSVLTIHYKLLAHTIHHLHALGNSSLLSTPTHTPCWIEANTLIKRLEYYQQQNIPIEPYDMQIALSRMVTDTKNLKINLDGELRALIEYIYSDKNLDIIQIQHPSYWIAPILRKANSIDMQNFAQKFQKDNHDVNFADIFVGVIDYKASKYNLFKSHSIQLIRTLSFNSIFGHTRLNPYYADEFSNSDIALYLAPSVPHFILEAWYKTLRVNEKTHTITLQALIEVWNFQNSNVYLYLARVIIDESKTVRTLASELWVKATSEGTMNHQLLGETLGKLQHAQYAPLKRFTDLIVANMLGISSLHNKSLAELLSAMIPEMNDEPIKGTKKLLEIYLEVLSLTEQKPTKEILDKLGVWGGVKSLKSIINKIKRI